MRMMSRLTRVIALAVAIVATTAFSAHAADYFGAIKLYKDGQLISEVSGGKTYLINDGGKIKSRTKITFRDVTADGWGTRAEVTQQGYCSSCTTKWYTLSQDKTDWYDVAYGWRTSYLTEYNWRSPYYRAKPKIVHHNPWYEPDESKSGSWQYP